MSNSIPKILTFECDVQIRFDLQIWIRSGKIRAIKLHSFTRNGIIWHFRVYLSFFGVITKPNVYFYNRNVL